MLPVPTDELVFQPSIAMLRTLQYAATLSFFASAVGLAADSAPTPASPIRFSANDWPCWRGAQGNGIASPDQSPPLHWSKNQNVVWKAAIPGRGHNSPIVVGDRVIVATAEEEKEV